MTRLEYEHQTPQASDITRAEPRETLPFSTAVELIMASLERAERLKQKGYRDHWPAKRTLVEGMFHRPLRSGEDPETNPLVVVRELHTSNYHATNSHFAEALRKGYITFIPDRGSTRKWHTHTSTAAAFAASLIVRSQLPEEPLHTVMSTTKQLLIDAQYSHLAATITLPDSENVDK